MRIYVTVASPYPRDMGATGWYQSLGSHSSVRPDGKLMVKKFATRMHESGYTVQLQVQSYLLFHDHLPLIPNPFHLSTVLAFRGLYTNLRYG